MIRLERRHTLQRFLRGDVPVLVGGLDLIESTNLPNASVAPTGNGTSH